MEQTFGAFLTRKRLEREFTLRGFAEKMGLSPVYICNLEKDRRTAPKKELLDKMSTLLRLDKQEEQTLLDLAARSQNAPAVSLDLPEYIMEHDIVRVALRTAKDADATDAEWQEFIEQINRRKARESKGREG